MERDIVKDLIKWKESKDRKPLILLGARQVGKTYVLNQFGKENYENVAYINCDNNLQVSNLFEDYNMERIILSIGAITGETIKPGKTLIILDEIQEQNKRLASLKYFCENASEYHVAVAGSLLGVTMHNGESFPVGKVNMMHMYPLSFKEFLWAKGKQNLSVLIDEKRWDVLKVVKPQLIQALREYYYIGGMPEVVKSYLESNDLKKVREKQLDILNAYEMDISKHVSTQDVVRIQQVWRSIPSQLAKENKKFIYGVLKKGGRAKEYETAIQWLVDAGLVYKISRVNKVSVPLANYEDLAAFKLYVLDCGLLGAMNNTPASMLLTQSDMGESKGGFTENYVCGQLLSSGQKSLYYYSKENSRQELDFVCQNDEIIYPIEVKAEENLRSKSLRTFVDENKGMRGLRFSMADYIEQDWVTNVPLYAVSQYFESI